MCRLHEANNIKRFWLKFKTASQKFLEMLFIFDDINIYSCYIFSKIFFESGIY